MNNDGKGSGDTMKQWMNRTINTCVSKKHPECDMKRMEFRRRMNIVRRVAK